MRGGDVVGVQGEGGWRNNIPEKGGVRWSCDFGTRRMGEGVFVVVFFVGCILLGGAREERCNDVWTGEWDWTTGLSALMFFQKSLP